MHLFFPKEYHFFHQPDEVNSTRVCIIIKGELPLLRPEQMIYGEGSARGVSPLSRRDVSGSPADAVFHTILVVEARPQGLFDIGIAS